MIKKILILTILFLLLVVVFAPIKLAESFIPQNDQLNISGMRGSLWSGSIDNVEIADWVLKDIDYSLSFFSLISGGMGGSSEIHKGDIKGSLSFEIADLNDLEISNANIEIFALKFEKYIPFPGIELNGKILTQDLNIQLVSKKPVVITGMTRWKNASVSFSNKQFALGNFNVLWETDLEKNLITGTIRKNQKNKLDIDGKINITKTGMLDFKGSIAASTEKSIYSAFSLFADGKVNNGRLPVKFKKKIF